MTRHLLDVDDLTADELAHVLALAYEPAPPLLAGKGVALLFEKPSARTRHSTEMAVVDLSGHPVTVRPDEVGLDSREDTTDVGRTLACYHASIGARVFDHSVLERLAHGAGAGGASVFNLLSDEAHPLQALADLLTIRDATGGLEGRTVAYIGDADNNVARSLSRACALAGVAVRIGAPEGYQPGAADLAKVTELGGTIEVFDDPNQAAKGADAVYTDVWVSMGDTDAEARHAALGSFTVTRDVMASAPDAVFMHCLPAHRGEEVAADVIDGDRSVVWLQAANRRSAARAALWFLNEPEGL